MSELTEVSQIKLLTGENEFSRLVVSPGDFGVRGQVHRGQRAVAAVGR